MQLNSMNEMRLILLGVFMVYTLSATAQLRVNADELAIQGETVFFVDGLSMVPSTSLSINNILIEKHPATIYWPLYNSIQAIHRFSRPVLFEGLLAVNYRDAELNSNKPASLALAHAPFTTINPNDFMIHLESNVNTSERRVSASYIEAIKLSDITAVTPESKTPAYMELEIHNIITPNDDGVNDYWIIKNIDLYPNNAVRIFDRDGRLVYSKLGYDNSWNGMFNGSPLPEDTYYYVLYLDSNKGKDTLTGYISLVRENE
jgi:gliding motility-associated-like protein